MPAATIRSTIDTPLEPVVEGGFGATEAPEFTVAPLALVRINPVPARRFSVGIDLAELGLAARDAERLGDRLVDHLFEAADHVDDDTRVRLLLPIKRDAYNGRSSDADDVATLGQALRDIGRDEAARMLDEWANATKRLQTIRQELSQGEAEQLAVERNQLADYLNDDRFLAALATSGPRLGQLPANYCDKVAEGRKPARGTETTLLRYANRAATKTSPFSWYTATHLVSFDEDGHRLESVVTAPRESHLELGRHLAGVITRDSDGSIHPSARISLAADLRVDGDQVRFTRRDRSGTYAAAQLPLTPQIAVLIQELAANEPGMLDITTLAAGIGERTGAPTDKLIAFVQGAGRAGLIAPYIAGSEDHDCDAERIVETALTLRHGPDRSRRWISEATAALDRYGSDLSVESRVEARDKLDSLILSATGSDEMPTGLPIFYEDVIGSDTSKVDDERLDHINAQLRTLLTGIEIFDDRLVLDRILGTNLRQRLEESGRDSIDLSELADLTDESYERALRIVEGVDDPASTGDEGLIELEARKDRLIEPFVEAFTRRSSEPPTWADPILGIRDRDVEIPQSAIEAAAQGRPEWLLRRPASYAAFVQPTDTDVSGAVINKLYPGWLAYFSRYLRHTSNDTLDRCREYLASSTPSSHLATETRPIEHFNANVHPLLTAQEIARPTSTPNSDAIDISSLRARPDELTGGVRIVDGNGLPILPLYLGFLVPMYLGRLERCLTLLAPNGTIIFEPQVVAERRMRAEAASTGSAETTAGAVLRPAHYSPRLVFGDIVLARSRWSVQAEPLVKLLRTTPGPERFAAVNEWRLELGLPETVFIRPPAPEYRADGTANELVDEYFARRKPQLVDFASRMAVHHLEANIGKAGSGILVVEEALPAPDQMVAAGSDGDGDHRHALELVIEVTRRAGR